MTAAASTPRLRILIADDHALIREGTRGVISREAGWEVCGQASNGREAVAQAMALKPDVVILDMTMPELSGLEAAVQIKRSLPETEIVMLSAYGSEDLVRGAFRAGVKSFIVKTETEEFLVEAVKALASHKPFLTPRVSQILVSSFVEPAEGGRAESEPGEILSTREREVLHLVAEGKTSKEVADALGIGTRTAENHRASILRKLNLESVADVVRYAIRNKMIDA
jgi:DNA-binding NarL/FixJ family response regulator